MTEPRSLPLVDCWNRVGVRGDRTCPELLTAIHCHNCNVFTSAAQTLLDRPAGREYLAELTQFVAEPVATRKVADRSAVLVRVGAEHFAIGTEHVLEAAEIAAPRRVPHRGNRVFAGLVNVRGQLELCVSLAGLLGIPRRADDRKSAPRALIVVHDGQRWVLAIDEVLGVQRFHEAQLVDPPAASRRTDSAYVRSLASHEGEHFAWLDVPRLCTDLDASVRGVTDAVQLRGEGV